MLVKRFAFDLEMLSIAYEHGFKVSEAPIKMHFGDKMGALNFAAVRSVMTDTLAIFYRLRLIRYYQHVELSELSSPPPRVSVIIACPGPSTYLDEALDGLSRQTLPPHEIIVLPDEPLPAHQEVESRKSEVESPAALPPGNWERGTGNGGQGEISPISHLLSSISYLPAGPTHIPVRVIPTDRVRPAEKRNMGIEAATGDVIAFLDDDASPQPQWLAQACRHFSRDKVGAVGGPAITPPRDPPLAQLGGEVYESPLVSGTARFRYVSERLRKVDDIPSCNLLVRASVLREVGGFNTRYWPGEDTILCLDIVRRGYEMVYDPFAVVFHHRRPLFGPHLRQIGRYAHHRGFFCRVFPQTSLRFSYMVPSLFVLGAILGPVACHFLPVLWPLYIGVMGFYLAITFIFAFKPRPHEWLILWLGIMSTHVWYGVRFIQGLLFGRMPKEVRGFDHGGESASVAEVTQIGDRR
jgi:cellulose synthase/poly-beta-1,6-N-acetylglucosamine synthase-like glycosyltransferase